MTLHRAFTLLLVVVSVGLVVLVLATAARRATVQRSARRRARLEAAARPALMALLHDAGSTTTSSLGRTERRVLAKMAASYLGKLRGEDRAALVSLLEGDGTLRAAQRRSRSRLALRRSRAAELLGAAGWAPALWDLARLCHDRHAEVRLVAARALAKLGDPVAIPVLLNTLEEPAKLPVSSVARALAGISEGAGPRLRVALAATAPRARAIAADLLGLHGVVTAVDDLVATLRQDVDPDVRAACARALGRISSPRAVVPLLVAAEGDQFTAVRVEAVTALGLLGSGRAVPALTRALDDEDALVSERAAAALAALGTAGRSVLAVRQVAPGPAGRRAGAALARAHIAEAAHQRRRSPARRAA